MKRGFLFGLGCFLIFAVAANLASFLVGTFGPVRLVLAIGCVPLSVIVIRAAMSAPSHRSWLHAFAGWCLGFVVIDTAIFAAIGVAILVPGLK